jgi:hypothetical protein
VGAALVVGAAAAGPALARTVVLKGQVGYIGEWAFSARLDPVPASAAPEASYAGPLTMRHIGVCSADGPEERHGRLTAALGPVGVDRLLLSYEGTSCVYAGSPATTTAVVRGFMRCNGGAQVPIYFWIVTP